MSPPQTCASPMAQDGPAAPTAESLDKGLRRLRSACDSCHQAKIRCSGGSPCSTCRRSQSLCVYSPGTRLGRPKGSKNKRTLMQEASQIESLDTQDKENSTTPLATDGGRQRQHYSDPKSFDHDFNNDLTTADGHFSNEHFNLLIDPTLNSLDVLDVSAIHPSPDQEHGNFFLQGSDYSTESDGLSPDDTAFNLSSPRSMLLSDSSHGITQPASMGLRCSCLQQLAKLLCHLGDLQCSNTGIDSVDSVLKGVQLAQAPWQSLMMCDQCHNDESQQEVMLLFSMGIRILLSSIQRVMAAKVRDPSATRIAVSLGSFELTGDAKAEVIDMAMQRALQATTSASLHLLERTGRPRSWSSSADVSTTTVALESAISLAGTADKPQLTTHRHKSCARTTEKETLASLLKTLQATMRLLEQDA